MKNEDLAISCRDPILKFYDSKKCSSRCSSLKAYATSSMNLMCFHLETKAVDISRAREPCQCGYMAYKHGNRESCKPEIIVDAITNDPVACEVECFKYTILRLRNANNGIYEIVWCGIIHPNIKRFQGLNWKKKEITRAEDNVTSYKCVCGLNSLENITSWYINDNKISKEKTKINELVFEPSGNILPAVDLEKGSSSKKRLKQFENENESREFVAPCSFEPFETASKKICQSTCKLAKAYFLLNNDENELICYHKTKQVQKITSFVEVENATVQADNVCQCGRIINERKKKYRYELFCVPEMKYEMLIGKTQTAKPGSREISKCKKLCAEYTIYIFNFHHKQETTRCELNTFSPNTYENLEWKVDGINKKGKQRHYYCQCGLATSPLSNNESLHRKSMASSSRTDNNTRNVVRLPMGKHSPHTRHQRDTWNNIIDDTSSQLLLNNDSTENQENATLYEERLNYSQPVGDLNIPSSMSTNTNVIEFNGESLSQSKCSVNVSQCATYTQQEACKYSTEAENVEFSHAYILREQQPSDCYDGGKSVDFAGEFMQPTGNSVIPSKICTRDKEIGQSSKYVLPDLNIPFEISTEEENSPV